VTGEAHAIGRHPRNKNMRRLAIVLAGVLAIPLLASAMGPPASGAVTPAARACGWAIVPSPSPGTVRNFLFGAAGAPGGQVWAVGERTTPPAPRGVAPVVEHWNGSAWTVRVLPGNQSNLTGVYAPSPANVWAVGFYLIAVADTLPVIDHFTGTRWVMVPSPRLRLGLLSGIGGTSAANIWAVGWRFFHGTTLTVIEHYNGHTWVQVPSPSPRKTDFIDFGAISVLSRHDIWVAGDYKNANGVMRTLIEHYNGHAWAIVRSPNIGPGDNFLSGIAALGPRNVLAVGRAFDGSRFRPLAMAWNGHVWRAHLLPAAGSGDNSLNGLTAGAGHVLWAVGSATGPIGSQRTLTEQYRSGHWRIVASPNANKADNVLYAATATRRQVWAVGSWFSPSQGKTVTMRRCQP
jgi:hypothetical protein